LEGLKVKAGKKENVVFRSGFAGTATFFRRKAVKKVISGRRHCVF
jgi:hypothetical protein